LTFPRLNTFGVAAHRKKTTEKAIMAEIVNSILIILSILLLSYGVFSLFGPGWSYVTAGASLYVSLVIERLAQTEGAAK
jgi:hypothetical protein